MGNSCSCATNHFLNNGVIRAAEVPGNLTRKIMYECLICCKPVPDYEPSFCCNGRECGCMGQPTEPCVCSDACADALYNGIGKTYEQRRIDAGIEVFKN